MVAKSFRGNALPSTVQNRTPGIPAKLESVSPKARIESSA